MRIQCFGRQKWRETDVILGALLWISVLAACGNGRSSNVWQPENREPPAAAATDRHITVVEWDTIWMLGGQPQDTSLLRPGSMVAVDSLLYVLDFAGPRVTAIGIGDGRVHWMFGTEGRGPNEFRQPIALASIRTGGVAVTDPGNRRITILRSDGQVSARIPIPLPISWIGNACVLRNGDLVVETNGFNWPLARISRTGRIVARLRLPWPDVRGAPLVARQTKFAPLPGHLGCVIALVMGRGFALFYDGRVSDPHGYVEWFNLPRVRTQTIGDRGDAYSKIIGRRIAATDVAVEGGTLAIVFEGQSEYRGHLIDNYDAETGEYIDTYWFSEWISDIARVGPNYYIRYQDNGFPVIIAVRPVRD